MKYIKYIWLLFGCFSFGLATAQTPEQLKSWLPAVDGWIISEETEVFNPDNLFDRINGAAPLFIENNFREMTSMEYKKEKDYITIQAYRHATPEDAFGMYASERTSEMNFYPIGGEGQGDDAGFFFFAGNMYIKMWINSSVNGGDILREIAAGFAEKIDKDAAYPALLSVFPSDGKIPYSEAYITANYIGHEFLNHVYLAKYIKDGKPFQLFIVDGGSAEGTKEILNKYYTFARQPLEFSEGELLIKDRYNGDIPAIWKGRYLIGAFSENGDTLEVSDLLNAAAAGL